MAQRQGGPDRSVGPLVAIRVCHQSGVGFGDTGHITQSRRSVIAGSGIDAGQVDCHEQTVLADWLSSDKGKTPLLRDRVAERFRRDWGQPVIRRSGRRRRQNSVLKLMAATLLAEGTSTITNCPDILDVPLMAEVLRGLGATVEADGDVARITAPDEPVRAIRCDAAIPRLGRHRAGTAGRAVQTGAGRAAER